jgi:hypothetical protein
MTWEQIFLGCFAFGFVLSLIAFVAGSAHLHLHMHHGGGVAHAHGASGAHHGSGVSKFNFGTIAAFLTWFGGTGYILSSWGRIGIALILIVAVAIGLVGAVIIFLFAAKVLAPADRPLDPADYRMVGSLGTVSCPVTRNGTGEMIFVQQGRRSAVPIRSESGSPIPSGKEVVVTRYEQGIAYVREWEELTA